MFILFGTKGRAIENDSGQFQGVLSELDKNSNN